MSPAAVTACRDRIVYGHLCIDASVRVSYRGTVGAARRTKPTADGILEAAERIFDRQGYGATSLRELIAEAGVSSTAFYARYPSKDAVAEALVSRLLSDVLASASTAFTKAPTPKKAFDEAAAVVAGTVRDHRVVLRLALSEGAAIPAVRLALENAYGALAMLVASRLERLADRKLIRAPDPAALGWAMVGAVILQTTRWAVLQELDDDAFARQLKRTARALWDAVRI